MAKLLVSDDLWAALAPLLPPEPPKLKSGRPRLADRAALTGILFVLKSGLPWEMLPVEMGCGSGMSCWRRLRDWYEAGVWTALHRVLLERLQAAGQIDWRRVALDSASVRQARPTATTAAQAARRQGLWLPALPPRMPHPWHTAPHRAPRRGKHPAPEPSPLGGRAHPCLAEPNASPQRALRTQSRHLPGLHHARLRPRLPPSDQAVPLGVLNQETRDFIAAGLSQNIIAVHWGCPGLMSLRIRLARSS